MCQNDSLPGHKDIAHVYIISMAPEPTCGTSGGPFMSDVYRKLSHYLNWTLILKANVSVYLTSRTDFDSGLLRLPDLDTLILITVFYV
jgi:hypothetical protein